MKVLLDTHAFLWWLAGDPRLSDRAREAIADTENVVFVSAAAAWEICTKFRIGKLPGASEVAADVAGCVASQGFTPLEISMADAQRAGLLPGPHRDPFDRMLVAQAQALDVPLVSNEAVFDEYGVRRLW
ncbi:MAG: type II toxin-antitoxin system VapC family toxin [Deltaproteobacteria bacterium]|nr:type II toxin-antitoxin system VapC family toxin [Deltaproteobacteria bacterium]